MTPFRSNPKGQGALEYLLLIGGAVLVATIVLVMAIGGIFPSTQNVIDDNLNNFQSTISLNTALGGGGGPGPGPGPTCDGDLACEPPGEDNSNCPSDCPSAATCGNGVIDPTEECDASFSADPLNGQTCTSIPGGYAGGTLGCHPPSSAEECTFDESACTSPPASYANLSPVFNAGATGSGIAVYDFSWTGSQFPTGADGTEAGLLFSPFDLPDGFSLPKSSIIPQYQMAYVPNVGKPLFVPTSGASGTQQGVLLNSTIKSFTNPPRNVIMVGQDTSPSFPNNVVVVTSSPITFPIDSEAPAGVTLTPSTGSVNGGQISLSFPHMQDIYMGGAYPGAIGSYELAYYNTPFPTDGSELAFFDNTVPLGQKKSGPTPQSSGTANDSLNFNQGIVPSSANNYVAVKACDKVDWITPTANCKVISAGPVTASKDVQVHQAEVWAVGAGLDNTTIHNTEGVLIAKTTGCSGGTNNNSTQAITFNIPASPNSTYRVWLRAANTAVSGNADPTIRLFPAFTGIPSASVRIPSINNNFIWRGQNSSGVQSLLTFGGSNQSLSLELQCAQAGLKIDKILFTTDTACVPSAADGSPCI